MKSKGSKDKKNRKKQKKTKIFLKIEKIFEKNHKEEMASERKVHVKLVSCFSGVQLDPIVHREFVQWREKPALGRELPLIQRIYAQEIEPNFEFSNTVVMSVGFSIPYAINNNGIV